MLPPPARFTLFPYTTLFRSPRTFCIMGQRLNLTSKLKPIGVGEAKASLNRATKFRLAFASPTPIGLSRSEEHTSELQSLRHLVCRLLLEKKKKKKKHIEHIM